MRTISLSLVAVLSLSIALAGGGAIAGERALHSRHLATEAESAQPDPVPMDRLYYGGTLAPIVVEGMISVKVPTRAATTCSTGRAGT